MNAGEVQLNIFSSEPVLSISTLRNHYYAFCDQNQIKKDDPYKQNRKSLLYTFMGTY